MEQVVIIPTLNPDGNLVRLVHDLRHAGLTRVIVVDDGSSATCKPIFTELAACGVHVCHHPHNRGKGAAIRTGLECSGRAYPDARAFVTADGDGQHLPADVVRCCLAQSSNPDAVVLGQRNLKAPGVPLRSRLGNGFSSLYFRLDTGTTCHDTQTGLRVVPTSLIPLVLTCQGDRYELEMDFITKAVKTGIPVIMVPISTVYLDGNHTSHFHAVSDSLRIYRSFLRFALASLSCAAVDLELFALLTTVLGLDTAALIVVSTFLARMTSGVLNFALNRQWSFRAGGRVRRQFVRYVVLFMLQMLTSMLLVTLLSGLPLPLALTKAIVDSALFVVSYFVQRNWVFREPARHPSLKGAGNAGNTSTEGESQTSPVPVGMRVRCGAGGLHGFHPLGCLRHLTGADKRRSC